MKSFQIVLFALLAVSLNGQSLFSINLNKTYYPFAQDFNPGQNTTNLCSFSNMVTLKPIEVPNQNGNYSGFQVSGAINKNTTNCRTPSIISFVKSMNDLSPLYISSSDNKTDFNNVFVVDNVNNRHVYKLINQINNAYSANLNMYVYHNDTSVDNYVQQVLKLINTSAKQLIVCILLSLISLVF